MLVMHALATVSYYIFTIQGNETHNNPVANTADSAIFRFLGICNPHMLLRGSTSMEKSEMTLIMPVVISRIFVLTQRPGVDDSHIFFLGVHVNISTRVTAI